MTGLSQVIRSSIAIFHDRRNSLSATPLPKSQLSTTSSFLQRQQTESSPKLSSQPSYPEPVAERVREADSKSGFDVMLGTRTLPLVSLNQQGRLQQFHCQLTQTEIPYHEATSLQETHTLPLVSLNQQKRLQRFRRPLTQKENSTYGIAPVQNQHNMRRFQPVSVYDLYGDGRATRKQKRAGLTSWEASSNKESPESSAAGKADATKEANTDKASAEEATPTATLESEKQDEGSIWTVNEEATLLRMKDEGTAWSAIAKAIGKTVDEVEKRYGSVMGVRAENSKKKGKAKADSGEFVFVGAEEEAVPDAFLRDDASDIDPCVEGIRASAFEVDDPVLVRLDVGEDVVSGGEAILLTRLHDYYDAAKWVAIASKFFDETGRRIEPEVLRHRLGRNGE